MTETDPTQETQANGAWRYGPMLADGRLIRDEIALVHLRAAVAQGFKPPSLDNAQDIAHFRKEARRLARSAYIAADEMLKARELP